jgi:hypothetical protein
VRLVFSGHRNYATEDVSPDALRTRCSRHGNTGCFHHNVQWREQDDVLTITFSPVIILNSELDEAARREALQHEHEQRHFRDFRGLASSSGLICSEWYGRGATPLPTYTTAGHGSSMISAAPRVPSIIASEPWSRSVMNLVPRGRAEI